MSEMNMNEMSTEKGPSKAWMWIVPLLIVVQFFVARFFSPISPKAILSPEAITPAIKLPLIGDFALTNTILTVLIADALLILAALAVSRAYKDELTIPKGVAGVFEFLVEALNNLTVTTAGKWARKIFPFTATIFILVLSVNLMKLLPGVESIGLVEHVEDESPGYAVQKVGPFDLLVKPANPEDGKYMIVPFVRPSSTDLNFTLAIALVTMTVVQIFGFRSQGAGYLTKFFNVRAFTDVMKKKEVGAFDAIMPFINLFVGILELISEIARTISLTFRLLGSMFAGAVLLFVMGSLFLFLQSGFLFLELFFGFIQAFIFSVLGLIFMTMATTSHESHEEKAES